jgi:hypothetical protein
MPTTMFLLTVVLVMAVLLVVGPGGRADHLVCSRR